MAKKVDLLVSQQDSAMTAFLAALFGATLVSPPMYVVPRDLHFWYQTRSSMLSRCLKCTLYALLAIFLIIRVVFRH